MKFTRLGAFTLGVVITAASVGAVSFVNAADDTKIKACANKKTGAMRYIEEGKCKTTETSLSWNERGSQGLPGAKGADGAAVAKGAKGDTGAAGAAGAKGDTGAAGAAGAAGAKGDTGAAVAVTTTTVPSQRVGDTGPGGGPIFYVDTAGLYPFTYLEVAPSNAIETAKNCIIGGLDLSKDNTTSGVLTSDAFGQGQNNTLTLLAMCRNNVSPYSPPFDTLINSFNEGWFIPSIAEMKLLVNAEKLGLINLSRPLRDPISESSGRLMTSSLHPDNTGNSSGAYFWSWIATADNYPAGGTEYTQFTSNAIRLIRAT